MTRVVVLREESDGRDIRHLDARIEPNGDLLLSGHDLGPSTASVAPDGEYTWFRVVSAEHLPALLRGLGGTGAENTLAYLDERASAAFSYELEAVLRSDLVPSVVTVR